MHILWQFLRCWIYNANIYCFRLCYDIGWRNGHEVTPSDAGRVMCKSSLFLHTLHMCYIILLCHTCRSECRTKALPDKIPISSNFARQTIALPYILPGGQKPSCPILPGRQTPSLEFSKADKNPPMNFTRPTTRPVLIYIVIHTMWRGYIRKT